MSLSTIPLTLRRPSGGLGAKISGDGPRVRAGEWRGQVTQTQAFRPKSLDERKLEIRTTTTHTRAPELHISTSPRLHACSVSPELQSSIYLCASSTTLRLQHAARAPCLDASYTSLHPQHVSRAPDLHTSTRPHLHACSAPSELQSSIPLHIHIYTPAAHLHTSIPLRLLHVPTPVR